MLNQARVELPNECCGLLAGRISDNVGKVEQRYPLVNDLASPREYNAEPKGLFAAFKDMRSRCLDLLAIYHSHPTSEPIPSRADLDRNAYGPDLVYVIVGLQEATPVVRAWRLFERDFQEAVWEVVE